LRVAPPACAIGNGSVCFPFWVIWKEIWPPVIMFWESEPENEAVRPSDGGVAWPGRKYVRFRWKLWPPETWSRGSKFPRAASRTPFAFSTPCLD
jgi:hypothetical protein